MTSYDALIQLFHDFRKDQEPPVVDGVHDYSAGAMSEQLRRLPEFRARLDAISTTGWTISQKADQALVRAEMNGLEFDHRVLRPWERDPAFFSVIESSESDVPAREAPRMHDTLGLFTYSFPLGGEEKEMLYGKIKAIPGILAHAKTTLTAKTKDLHFLGIGQKKRESRALRHLAERLTPMHPDLVPLVEKAGAAVEDFIGWLEHGYAAMPDSTDGIGMEEFDWAMKRVHLVPYCWEEQEAMIRRELERSWTALKLEEHRNRNLPPLTPPATVEEWQARLDAAYPEFLGFLRTHDIFTAPDYMRVIGAEPRSLVPPEHRDFFTQVSYHHVLPLLCHMVHWLEKQREERNTHPLRREAPLYNIWDSRAEGFATAFEETMLQAGILDKAPRARELVYILLAFRAARALGDLYMHGRRWTMRQAMDFAAAGTPRGWVKRDGDTVLGDIGLYLRQPGYGTSYVVGKIQFERLVSDRGMQLGDRFNLKEFLDAYFALGMVPASLIRWEMTGHEDEIRKLNAFALTSGEEDRK